MVIAHGQVLEFVLKPRGRHMISTSLEGEKGQTATRDYTIEGSMSVSEQLRTYPSPNPTATLSY